MLLLIIKTYVKYIYQFEEILFLIKAGTKICCSKCQKLKLTDIICFEVRITIYTKFIFLSIVSTLTIIVFCFTLPHSTPTDSVILQTSQAATFEIKLTLKLADVFVMRFMFK